MFVAALVLVGMAAILAIGNWFGVIAARRRGGSFSTVPLFSLVLSVAAWLLAGDRIGVWAFAPAAIDPATWSLVWLPVFLLLRRDT